MILKMDKQLPLKKRKSSIEFNTSQLQQLVNSNQLYVHQQQQQLFATLMSQLLAAQSTNNPTTSVDTNLVATNAQHQIKSPNNNSGSLLTLANSQQAQLQLQQQLAAENLLSQQVSQQQQQKDIALNVIGINQDSNTKSLLNLSTKNPLNTLLPLLAQVPQLEDHSIHPKKTNNFNNLIINDTNNNNITDHFDHNNIITNNTFCIENITSRANLTSQKQLQQQTNNQLERDHHNDDNNNLNASNNNDSHNSNNGDDQPQICMICEDKATGLHYGIITCEGCKGFFKRTVQNKRIYTCASDNKCAITKQQRNRCQSCRLQKCLKQGMVLAAVREDRMPGGRNSGAVYNLYKVKYKKHKKNNQSRAINSSASSTTSTSSTSSSASSTSSSSSTSSLSLVSSSTASASSTTGSAILKSALMSPILESSGKLMVPIMH